MSSKAKLNGGFIRVSWALNILTCHCIDKERGDKSFIGVERVSWG
jgi:hypothetical protein